MEFKELLNKKATLIERALEEYLPPGDAYPPIIHEAMRHSIMAGGKRLRPVLAISAAEAVGFDDYTSLLPAACALEFIHTYSLVHDDLPAMDDDDVRRGQPTCHKQYGEAVAILTGDALLTMAFELISNTAKEGKLPSERVLRVISEISRACCTTGLIGGQVVDTIYEDRVITPEELEYIHTRKTGALYKVAVRTGAILGGASEQELEKLSNYAYNLGLAFQIIDDVLDVEGDAEKLGKPIGSDVKNKKSTYPSLFGLDAARKKANEVVRQAEEELKSFGSRGEFLRELLHYVLSRNS